MSQILSKILHGIILLNPSNRVTLENKKKSLKCIKTIRKFQREKSIVKHNHTQRTFM